MNIHPATLKRAKAQQVKLSSPEDMPDLFKAERAQVIVYHPVAKTAVDFAVLVTQLEADAPNIDLDYDVEEGVFTVAYGANSESETVKVTHGEKLPSMAFLTNACDKAGFDPEEGDKIKQHNVVPNKYKQAYKDGGHPRHCGDWLATELEDAFTDEDKKFDYTAFGEFLEENGVDMTGPWASLPQSDTPGWQGRYRMNGRQKLEKVLAEKGFIKRGRNKSTPPREYLDALLDRHPDVEAKWYK